MAVKKNNVYVLGTAGHVDHGKSALVQALTGIDPDRLPEEKKRLMTIDLGFAWFTLPDGREISIIDVPGHEHFIHNMLAGVSGIDLVLLVIAADEGVMTQTKEHLAIFDVLNVSHGIVVLTKKDLVDKEGLQLAILEAEELISHSSLKGSPIIPVSSITKEGIPELIAAIIKLLENTPPRQDIGKPRLAIDRVFSIKGFGTVVTGTLIDGTFVLNQEVEILPPGIKTHIRGLETHKKQVEQAPPGSRVALNLANIPAEKLKRGMVITFPGYLTATEFLDVKLRIISEPPCPVKHNMRINFYSGTSETGAIIRLLDKDRLNAGEEGWAQLKLENQVIVLKDDPFIIRCPEGTLGGGRIVDTNPSRHHRFDTDTVENLHTREQGSPEDAVLAVLAANGPMEWLNIEKRSGLKAEENKTILNSLVAQEKIISLAAAARQQLVYSRTQWDDLTEKFQAVLQHFHIQFPLRPGMPREEGKSQLKIASVYYNAILEKWAQDKTVVIEGNFLRLPAHTIKPSPVQQAKINTFLIELNKNPFYPAPDLNLEPELLNYLVQQNIIVKMDDGVVYSRDAYSEMVQQITEYLKMKQKITVSEVRDLLHTSRKNTIALMEYLDKQKITRRVGDERVLR